MILQPLTPGSPDFARFEALLSAAGLPTEDLNSEVARYYTLSEDAEPLAYAGLLLRGEDAMLRSLVVPEGERGRGRGRAAVERLAEAARSEGARRLWLLTISEEKFFARNGWRQAERAAAPSAIAASRQFTTSCPASAVLMCRDLT